MKDDEVESAGYKSVKALNRYDCRAATFSTIKRVYLDPDQNVIREERVVEPKVIRVTPGSVDERLFREVCQPPTASRLAQIAEQAGEAAAAQAGTGATESATTVAGADKDGSGKSIVPQIVKPLSAAERQAAVAARIAAREHAASRRVAADGHGAVAGGAGGVGSGGHDEADPGGKSADHATADGHAEPIAATAEKSHKEAPARATKPEHGGPTERTQLAGKARPATKPKARKIESGSAKPRIVLARAERSGHGSKAEGNTPKAHVAWSYHGAGAPENWGTLDPQFAACGNGRRQSPIDINDGIKVDLAPIQFDYRPSYFRIVDNGHTVQVSVGDGSSVRVMGRTYDLKQFHFHRPSEFRIDGRAFDMEMHLVHKDLDGRLAVVSVMLERGTAHPIVQTLWNNLPLERHSSYAPEIAIDPNELLPTDQRYATFIGSLTTPPCTEGVLWMVMRQPVQMSPDQISIFSRLHPMNARPIQDMAGRLVKMSR
ncbi:MAG: carbonic anhydrase family protein [Rhodocyclaceae bacterium]|nr:carbonic anhydrase family protein [Rhodocyclaceae bacterium]